MPTGLGAELDPPSRFEPGAAGVVGDVLASWQFVGQGTHVAAALHIVLAAKRHQARPVPADVSGEEGQVDQGKDVVCRGVVLGYAEGPQQLGGLGFGVGVGEVLDRRCRHTGDPLPFFQRPRLY